MACFSSSISARRKRFLWADSKPLRSCCTAECGVSFGLSRPINKGWIPLRLIELVWIRARGMVQLTQLRTANISALDKFCGVGNDIFTPRSSMLSINSPQSAHSCSTDTPTTVLSTVAHNYGRFRDTLATYIRRGHQPNLKDELSPGSTRT